MAHWVRRRPKRFRCRWTPIMSYTSRLESRQVARSVNEITDMLSDSRRPGAGLISVRSEVQLLAGPSTRPVFRRASSCQSVFVALGRLSAHGPTPAPWGPTYSWAPT